MQETEFDNCLLPLRDKMYRYARSILRRSDEAEDVTHDTLERLWRERSRIAAEKPEAFAMTALRNGCYDRLRRRQVRTATQVETTQVAVSDDISRWSDEELVREAMKRLPDSQREAVHLKDIEGYETHEIAEMMSIPENQVRVVLSRGRKKLREMILKWMNDARRTD